MKIGSILALSLRSNSSSNSVRLEREQLKNQEELAEKLLESVTETTPVKLSNLKSDDSTFEIEV